MKNALVFTILIAVVSSHSAFASDIDLPTYVQLERQIAADINELRDPEMGLGEVFHKLSDVDVRALQSQAEYNRWGLKYRIALRTLIGGNVTQFNDQLLELTENVDVSSPEYGGRIANLLHIAVEGGAPFINAELFAQAVRRIEDPGQQVVTGSQRRLFLASYYFVTGRVEKLQQIALLAMNAEGANRSFVIGYCKLLEGKLEYSPALLHAAVQHFENIKAADDQPNLSLMQGRISLHMADAYRNLASFEKVLQKKREYIDAAVIASTTARRQIELMENPLMWGAAHRITSDVLDLLYVSESAESEGFRLAEIALRRDRAYELSLTYR